MNHNEQVTCGYCSQSGLRAYVERASNGWRTAVDGRLVCSAQCAHAVRQRSADGYTPPSQAATEAALLAADAKRNTNPRADSYAPITPPSTREHVARCARCSSTGSTFARTPAEAVPALVAHGWLRVAGAWFCSRTCLSAVRAEPPPVAPVLSIQDAAYQRARAVARASAEAAERLTARKNPLGAPEGEPPPPKRGSGKTPPEAA